MVRQRRGALAGALGIGEGPTVGKHSSQPLSAVSLQERPARQGQWQLVAPPQPFRPPARRLLIFMPSAGTHDGLELGGMQRDRGKAGDG
jgi:hypothetical protein